MRPAWLVAGVAALAVFATTAWACSCAEPQSAEAQLESATIAVVASVEGTHHEQGAGVGRRVTSFRVLRTLKGEQRTTWKVAHILSGAACGREFQPGERLILLARSEDGRLVTGECDRARFPESAYARASRR